MSEGLKTSYDFNRMTKLTPEVECEIEYAFRYQPWTAGQIAASGEIRRALAHAVGVIVQNAPPCQDRSSAIRKLREACMDANLAITFGKY
jgi:hypothetical protein